MNNDAHDNLDAAIDRAVRRMMAVDPPPGLRHRVLGRIARTDTPAFGWFPRMALAGAAVAAIVLAVLFLRPTSPIVQPAPSATVAAVIPAPLADPTPTVVAPAEPVAQPSTRPQPRREQLPEPPPMADVFGARDPHVAAASVNVSLDDTRTPWAEPGTAFRSPIQHLTPVRLEDLPLRIVPIVVPGINPR